MGKNYDIKNNCDIKYGANFTINSYFYVLLKNKETQQEYLEIVSDRDSEKLNESLLKIEETQ